MPDNEYPEIFQLLEGSSVPVYKMQVNPKSLEFGCIKRNDYPHYWCDLTADIIHSNQKYPKRITASYMSSRNIAFVKKYKEYVGKIKNEGKKSYLSVSYIPLKIDNGEIEPFRQFLGTFLGIETAGMCISWFNYFDNCSAGSKHVEL